MSERGEITMRKYERPLIKTLLIGSADCITSSDGLGAPQGERDVSFNAIWGTVSVNVDG